MTVLFVELTVARVQVSGVGVRAVRVRTLVPGVLVNRVVVYYRNMRGEGVALRCGAGVWVVSGVGWTRWCCEVAIVVAVVVVVVIFF